jgi:hypothetical protein
MLIYLPLILDPGSLYIQFIFAHCFRLKLNTRDQLALDLKAHPVMINVENSSLKVQFHQKSFHSYLWKMIRVSYNFTQENELPGMVSVWGEKKTRLANFLLRFKLSGYYCCAQHRGTSRRKLFQRAARALFLSGQARVLVAC